MTNDVRVIFLGESQLLYNCARKIRNYYGQNAWIKIFDVSDSTTQKKKKLQDEFGDTKDYESRQDLFEYLSNIQEKTYLFSINNPYLIPSKVCENRSLCMVNLHHALLPKHPGRNAAAWTIFDQDEYGGITWHFINAEVDSGSIILQKEIAITEDMTALKLLRLCEKAALDSFDAFMPLENIEEIVPRRQNGEYRYQLKKAKDVPNNGMLDLSWDIHKCRAFLNSINFGMLYEMGKAKVAYRNKLYTVKNYFVSAVDETDKERIIFSEGETSLTINEDHTELKLLLEI